MESNYQLLLRKLNEFIRRYYSNELLKGVILTIGLMGIFFLTVILLEYFGKFGTAVRTIFFWVYILLTVAVLIRWIFVPLFKLFHVGKTLSYEEAARIIGSHFSEVSDVLTNTLQLKNNNERNVSSELIEASINQKINQLKPVPFQMAVSYKTAVRYLKYGLPPIAILLILFLFNPAVVTKPAERIVRHNESFVPPPPFTFEIINSSLNVMQSEDFELKIKVLGDILPDAVFVNRNNMSHRMKALASDEFSYHFSNIQKNIRFNLSGGDVESDWYEITVVTKPQIVGFEAILKYPAYTGLKTETQSNNPDLLAPEGTTIVWNFYTQDSKWLILNDGEEHQLNAEKGNQFMYEKRLMGDFNLSLIAANQNIVNNDTIFLSAKTISDAYPAIVVEQKRDSIYDQRLYFHGMIEDDYGFSKLVFVVNRTEKEQEKILRRDTIVISKAINRQDFFHFCNLPDIGVVPGDQISYYFEVFDNDGIHGAKSTRSQTLYYKAPTMEEMEKQTEQSNENIRASMDNAMKAVQDMQREIDKLRHDLLQKPNLEWEDKQRLEELMEKQKNVEQMLEQVKKENVEKARKEEQYREVDESLVEKQRELEKLFDELMTDEMRKMFDEMQKMMDKLQKEDMQKMLDKMKMSNKEISEQLDRDLELFRQLEFEKDLRESIEDLEKLAQEEKDLSKEAENATKEQSAEIKEKQDALNERLDQLKEKLDEMEKKDQALSAPNNFEKPQEAEKKAEESMKEASENLDKKNNKKASDAQKKASESMQEMADKLNAFESQMNQESMEEDIDDLRQILENLLRISFAQEVLIGETKAVKTADPRYVEVGRQQHILKDDFKIVEDSLKALAKRQMMISSMIYNELKEINFQFEETFKQLEARRPTIAMVNQQKAMTSINNLTLMLDESLQQMQAQQNAQCNSDGNASKPGKKSGGKSSAKSMRDLQQQLGKQLEEMQEQMQKSGQNQQQGQSMSEQLVRAAAQQQAIREMMQEYAKQLKDEGYGVDAEMQKSIQQMEQNETDIINRAITKETLRRQQEIVTRLLNSEKAEMQREEEKRRESTEAKTQQYSNPEDIFKGKNNELGIKESIKVAPAEFKPYYQKKTGDYLYRVE